MPVPARFVAAGMLLALTLATVPLVLLPLDFAGAGSSGFVQAARHISPAAVDPAGRPTLPAAHPVGEPTPPALHLATPRLAVSSEDPNLSTPAGGPDSPSSTPPDASGAVPQEANLPVDAPAEPDPSSPWLELHAGELLVEPSDGGQAAPQGPSSNTHTVVLGETLWGISQGAGIRVEALAAANHISLDAVLHPGQVLVIPPPGTPVPVVPESRAPAARGAGRGVGGTPPMASLAARGVKTAPMALPSSGTITSRFGWRIHPIFGTREFHTGLDIAARLGTPVRAARSGIVRFVGWMAGYGRLIIVDHGNGLETTYSHLSAAVVRLGQQVAMGQILGRIGNTGWSTGPHLLFEVRWNGVPLDPSRFLQ